MIHMIGDRLHVGDSDESVILYFLSRLKKGSTDEWSAAKWAEIIHQVVAAHRENQALYRAVMG